MKTPRRTRTSHAGWGRDTIQCFERNLFDIYVVDCQGGDPETIMPAAACLKALGCSTGFETSHHLHQPFKPETKRANIRGDA
jgi:hypothetical protein